MALETEKDTFQSIKNIVKPIFDMIVHVDVEGLDSVPETGPALLVGNHRSDMDPFIVASRVTRYISWIAAEYTERIPVFKNLTRATGVIPMDIHGNVTVSSIKRLMSVLRNGDLLGIFPEGHDYIVRNDFAAPLHSFHDGFGTFAYRAKAPIVPFVIVPLEENIETMPIPGRVRQLFGLPEEVCEIPHRVQYRSVRLVFAEPIEMAEYRASPEKESVPRIVGHTRDVMHRMQIEAGMLPTGAALPA